MQSLVQNLHSLNAKYVSYNPALFGRYLAGISAPMNEEELEAQKEVDRRLQEELRRNGFGSGSQSRKRGHVEETEHQQLSDSVVMKWT
jgi:hypothetical protein